MNKFYTVLIFSLSSILFTSCRRCAKQNENDILFPGEDYLKRATFTWDSLYNAKNSDELSNLYADDGFLLPFEKADVKGKENIRKEFESFFNANDSIDYHSFVNEITSENNWSVERSTFMLRFKPKKNLNMIYISGRCIITRQKRNDKWVIYWQMWNNSPMPQKTVTTP